jgi:hypothetical protein
MRWDQVLRKNKHPLLTNRSLGRDQVPTFCSIVILCLYWANGEPCSKISGNILTYGQVVVYVVDYHNEHQICEMLI